MWYKVLDRIVKDRIEKDIAANNTPSDEQAGFRSGKTCQDQIFILETIADMAKKRGKPLYCCLIDLRKAFDSINRRKLYETMRETGIDPETTAILGEMCN